jgi:hypothetical protein
MDRYGTACLKPSCFAVMAAVYISNQGTDENDGFSPSAPIYSWHRALSLVDEQTEVCVAGVAALQRLASEIEAQIRKEAYSKSDWG